MEVKLEDRDRASQFRIDLRKVSLPSNAPASIFSASSTALGKNDTVSKNRGLRCANVQRYQISSALDVFDSGFGPTSQLPSSSPESSYDRVSLAPSLSYTSDDSYCPGRSSSPSSSDTDHPTVSEKPVRSVPQGFAKLKVQYADYKPTTKPILAVQDLRLKRRHSEEDKTAAASGSTPTKKMRYKKIDTLNPAPLLTSQPHTAWQYVDATTTQTAASSRDAIWGPRSYERYWVPRRRL